MKSPGWLALLGTLLLVSCQPNISPTLQIYILDQGQQFSMNAVSRIPNELLSQARINLEPQDRLLADGLKVASDRPLAPNVQMLQIRRAVDVTLQSPTSTTTFRSAALTVGEALGEQGLNLSVADRIDPPLNTPLTNNLKIIYQPARAVTITADGRKIQLHSSARTVAAALAEAELALTGADYTEPTEQAAIPQSGQIRLIRVREDLVLAQTSIPFESELQGSAEVPLDQTQILQPGENGLAVRRIRVRYEDGQEVARVEEAETQVWPPRTRLLGYGTKVEVKTAKVNGVQIEYWRAVQMYATSYSPCRVGTSSCSNRAASGATLRKGVVGLRSSWYASLQGQQVYIPGYGFGTVEDICGGCVGQPWIDLGYSDNDYQAWHTWVTVYFLTPVPAHIIYIMQ